MKKLLWSTLVGLLVVGAYILYNNMTYEFKFDKGVKYEDIVSPTGEYTAQVYYHYYGGAAGGVNVYVNVVYHSDHDKTRTVYYSDAKNNFRAAWTDADQLSITNVSGGEDRSIVLAVETDIYDENGRACRKYPIVKNFTCYSKSSD